MQGDAYGMFLVHYPIVLWLQYWLFDYDLPADRQGERDHQGVSCLTVLARAGR